MTYLRRYLVLQPTDAEGRAELGFLQAQLAQRGDQRIEALLTMRDALRANPNLPDAVSIRESCVRLALHPTVKLVSTAKQDLDQLLSLSPNNSQYEEWYGDAFVLSSEFTEAARSYTNASLHDPKRFICVAKLAWVTRKNLNKPAEADRMIAQLLTKFANSATAHLVAADYWRASEQPELANRAVAVAQKLAPDDPHVLLAGAEIEADKLFNANTTDAKVRESLDQETVILLTRLLAQVGTRLPDPTASLELDSDEERFWRAVKAGSRLLLRLHVRAKRMEAAVAVGEKLVQRFPTDGECRLDLLDALIGGQKLSDAVKLIEELQQRGLPNSLLNYHRGRIALIRGETILATRLLEQAAEGLSNNAPLLRQANLMLAECYQSTGELDRQYEAYRRATPTDLRDPTWVTAVAGAANTLAELGRTGDAIAEYQRLAAGFREFNVPLARLMIVNTLRQPEAQRDWSRVDALLKQIPPGASADLIQAELAAAQADLKTAAAQLDKSLAKFPDDFDFRVARVMVALRAKQPSLALELLKSAESAFPNSPDVRLLKLRILVFNHQPSADELRSVIQDLNAFSAPDRRKVLREVANVASQDEQTRPVAREALERLVAEFPNDLAILFQRFDLAVNEKDFSAMNTITEKVRQLTGENSVAEQIVQAFSLLARAESADGAQLATAARILEGLERKRPGWSRLQLALGRVAELQGDKFQAVRKFRRAIELGETSPTAVTRLLELYYETKQYTEADQVLRTLSVPVNAGPPVLLAELSLGAKDYAKVGEYAALAVPAGTKDVDRLLWQARMFTLCGKTLDAEKSLTSATEVASDRPEPWIALAQLLAATNQKEKANQVIANAKKSVQPKDLPFVMAQCQEVLGLIKEASQSYEELLKVRSDVPALRAAGSFYLRQGNRALARSLFERVLASTAKSLEDETTVRRLLAITLADSRDAKTSQRALEVLGLASVDAAATLTGQESIEDIRTRIVVLLGQRGRLAKSAAAKLLEALETRGALTPEDQFLFGRVNWDLGNRNLSIIRFRLASNAPGAPPEARVALFTALLETGNLDEAKIVAGPILKTEPDSATAWELKTRIAMAAGQKAEAATSATKYGEKIGRPLAAAMLLEAGGLAEEAESAYRQAASNGKVNERISYTLFLSRAGKFDRAIGEFESCLSQFSTQELPPAVSVVVACQIALQNSTAPPDQLAKLASYIDTTATTPQLMVYRAAMKSLLGDYPVAISLCESVLGREPENLLALNNLAYILSLKEARHDEALTLIRKALVIAGPTAELIDTEAVILLAKGTSGPAIEKLLELTADQPTAVVWFHLAQAYLAEDKMLEARAAFKAAKRLRLREADFHPLEHATVRDVSAKLTEQ